MAELEKQRQQVQAALQAQQEARAQAERDAETHRMLARDLQMELKREQDTVMKLRSASPQVQGPPAVSQEEWNAAQQQIIGLLSALDQAKENEKRALSQSAPPPLEGEVQRLRQLLDQKSAENDKLQHGLQMLREDTLRSASMPVQQDLEQIQQHAAAVQAENQRLQRELVAARSASPQQPDGLPPPQQLKEMLEMKSAECLRLQNEVRAAREETQAKVAELQEAMAAAAGTPMQLDAEFRDVGRAAIIALPHVITHLHNVIDNQDNIRALVPVTTVMMHALEGSRQRCAACIPQAVPQLVSLLVSRQPTTGADHFLPTTCVSASSVLPFPANTPMQMRADCQQAHVARGLTRAHDQ